MIPTLIVLALIALNGIFVAAEFAIIGSSRPVIDRAAKRGKRTARAVSRVLGDTRALDRYIATAQLGITSASLGLGMYGEHLLAEWLAMQLEHLGFGVITWIGAHALASVIAVAFLTYLHVVLGEMIPKSLALGAPSTVAMAIAWPMRAVELATYPIVVGLNGIGNGLLRLLGVERSTAGKDSYRTADEIGFLVAESRAGGLIAREPARIIHELLEFSELTAREVMVPRTRVIALRLGATAAEVADVLRSDRHTRYPVVDGGLDQIIGSVHVKDLLAFARNEGTLDRALVREVPFVPATHPLERVLAVVRRTRSHLAVVIDEHGGTDGILTVEDLFEEVVGDISDPGERPSLHPRHDGRISSMGTVRLDELGEAMRIEIEFEGVDTVSGLIIAKLGRPPVVGDRVEHAGVTFEVTAVHGRGVREALVTGAGSARSAP